MDFILKLYKRFLESLLSQKYKFLTVKEYFSRQVAPSPSHSLSPSPIRPVAIMRHDVDRKPQNALRMAKLENELGVNSTYYFRTISKTFKPNIIKEIADLGHEIGYHYENLATANSRMKNENPMKYSRSSNFTQLNRKDFTGHADQELKMKNYEERLFELAIKDFEENLEKLRKIVPIKNICMHGSPLSKWDSRDLWRKYNYKDYGITSEPYFDIDFDKMLYITDAGRSWDNARINKRDKVSSRFNFRFKHTNDIINAIEEKKLPDQLMINIHPEHWATSTYEWFIIWIIRKIKNTIKKMILRDNKNYL